MKNAATAARDQITDCLEETKELVREHSASSAAIAFGLGVGAGLAVVSLFADDGPHRGASMAERLGNQLLESLHSITPSSLTNR